MIVTVDGTKVPVGLRLGDTHDSDTDGRDPDQASCLAHSDYRLNRRIPTILSVGRSNPAF